MSPEASTMGKWAAMEAHSDFMVSNGDVRWHIDQVAEDLASLGIV